jgi:hypothetical protein
MTVAVYIGAALDVRPIRALKHIRHFIYIDSLPATQQPDYDLQHTQYQSAFMDRFCCKMEAMNFDWVVHDWPTNTLPFRVQFVRKGDHTVVEYYMNTPFPKAVDDKLRTVLTTADTLIIACFHPHQCIIDMMKKPVSVVCWEGTCYDDSDYDDSTVVKRLHQDMTGIVDISYFQKEYVRLTFNDIADVENFRRSAILS